MLFVNDNGASYCQQFQLTFAEMQHLGMPFVDLSFYVELRLLQFLQDLKNETYILLLAKCYSCLNRHT